MKKYFIFLFSVCLMFFTGCTIDYDTYYDKYGDVKNKDHNLTSVNIKDTVFNYPNSNTDLINNYSDIYIGEITNYKVFSTYYSSEYDTLYISYDRIDSPSQTIKSKQLALIEEHLLNYFVSDVAKSDYSKYLKVVRIYPDYKSSTCRNTSDSEEIYSKIEGCANYNSTEAIINLNGLTSIEQFFINQEGAEPKRDTFAHEFGHVSTYYNMILKSDDLYENYLRLRLGNAFDDIYPNGFPSEYDTETDYSLQPVEILADDYVELYYDIDEKLLSDYFNYDLEYTDYRNSLENIEGVVQYLKSDSNLYNSVKEYYDLYIDKEYSEYSTPIVINSSAVTYNTIHDIIDNIEYVNLDNSDLIAIGEIVVEGNTYYRVVLANMVNEFNIRSEYSMNIGYVLKSDCSNTSYEVLFFTKYNDELLDYNQYLTIVEGSVYLLPYYDFSYFIIKDNALEIYSYIDESFESMKLSKTNFE